MRSLAIWWASKGGVGKEAPEKRMKTFEENQYANRAGLTLKQGIADLVCFRKIYLMCLQIFSRGTSRPTEMAAPILWAPEILRKNLSAGKYPMPIKILVLGGGQHLGFFGGHQRKQTTVYGQKRGATWCPHFLLAYGDAAPKSSFLLAFGAHKKGCDECHFSCCFCRSPI